MKKRVLLVSSVHPPNDPRIVYKIAPALSKHFDLTCVLPRAKVMHFPENTQVMSLPFFNWLGWRILCIYPVLLWKYRKIRPDIVHFFVPELIPFALICQWMGASVIYEVQENLYQKLPLKQKNNEWLFKNAFYFFDRIARKKFHFIFTEDAYLHEYRQITHSHMVIHNYSTGQIPDATDEKRTMPSFLYSGVISKERGLDTIIKACHLLKNTYTDFFVYFFGQNIVSRRVMENIDGFKAVSGHLIFHGYTDYKKVLEAGKSCIAGLAVLKPVGDYTESYPSKIFDYMGLGIPVITSDFPLYRKVVEDGACGFCIDPENPQILAEKMAWMMENPESARLMGKKGYQLLQSDYNWTTEKARLITHYEQILRREQQQ